MSTCVWLKGGCRWQHFFEARLTGYPHRYWNFSPLDRIQGTWHSRKRKWKEIVIAKITARQFRIQQLIIPPQALSTITTYRYSNYVMPKRQIPSSVPLNKDNARVASLSNLPFSGRRCSDMSWSYSRDIDSTSIVEVLSNEFSKSHLISSDVW
jgi:hypothetical protein